jgi:hypothetical protein
VTFPNGTLTNAVGASIRDGAVTEATGGLNRPNQEDEVGLSNTNTSSITPGRTVGPDLEDVRMVVQQRDPFTNAVTDWRVIYDFDANIIGPGGAALDPADFSLWTANGTQLVCAAGFITGGSTANDGPDTVRCTKYVFAAGGDANASTVGSAVLGTVDDAAVARADNGALTNPEGAEVTSGGTGTPA